MAKKEEEGVDFEDDESKVVEISILLYPTNTCDVVTRGSSVEDVGKLDKPVGGGEMDALCSTMESGMVCLVPDVRLASGTAS